MRDGAVAPVNGSYGIVSKADPLCTAPAQLLQALWKDELRYVASANRCNSHSRMRVDELTDEISELVPLREIRAGVCERLRARDWGYRSGQVGPTSDPDPERAVWAKDIA